MQVSGQTRHPGGRPRLNPPSALFVRIEAMAKRRGMHLDELAERAGVTRQCIYQLNDPKVSTAKALADALGVTIDRLMRTAEPSRGNGRSARRPA